jgi:hypothetical protein
MVYIIVLVLASLEMFKMMYMKDKKISLRWLLQNILTKCPYFMN